jgi:hypothetical protein
MDTYANLPRAKNIWLTSFWGFDPKIWGCVGFSQKYMLSHFMEHTMQGALVVVYVTKGKGPDRMRGNIVGILEVSRKTGHARNFISADQWEKVERDPESRGKWHYAVEVTRAWKVIEEDWKPVESVFPITYSNNNHQRMGGQGAPIDEHEVPNLLGLSVCETPVYGQESGISPTIQSLDEALKLKPSNAVLPATEPYWVGETDGPKHLYILRLRGNIGVYLGAGDDEVDDHMIVKVGFSKSPLTRRDQIQSAYPDGQFKWEVLYPAKIPETAPYPNARVAIAGEDAMKRRLENDGGKSLGGEFFLADMSLIIRTWSAGMLAAETFMRKQS